MGKVRRDLLTMGHAEARGYFMRQGSYFSTQLPPYFNFTKLLEEMSARLDGHRLDYFCVKDPTQYQNVNYKIFNNKDGEYAWRPLQLMHPAFYVDLVNFLTIDANWKHIKKRIEDFRKSKRVVSRSNFISTEEVVGDRPLEVINWWHKVEQESVRLALDYEFTLHTDITSCYDTISEQLIAAALGEEVGGYINRSIRGMTGGKHYGVPQGSNLMDLIAEAALGYVDWRLSNTLVSRRMTKGYLVLRYRDDYRIFTNNSQLAEDIARTLADILAEYGMKLNPSKTALYNDVITASIKPDKIYWNERRALLYINDDGEVGEPSIQRHLLAIRELAKAYPGSGSVQSALVDIYKKRIHQMDSRPQNLDQLVSIVVDIALSSPRVYYVCAAILSKFIPLYNKRSGRKMLLKIRERFERVPNSDYFEICLQRITIAKRREEPYKVPLCKAAYSYNAHIWNSEWLSFTVDERSLIDTAVIDSMDEAVPVEEVDLFSPFDSNDAE